MSGALSSVEARSWTDAAIVAPSDRLDELAQIADRPELTGPVLIIVGDVVAAGAIGAVPARLSELAA